MKKFKAAVFTGVRKIEVLEFEWSDPAPGYVAFEPRCSGICGSDLHSYEGHWDPPRMFATGHEASGVVHTIGEGVIGLQPGDRITFEGFSHCGSCIHCVHGDYNHCINRKGASHNAHGGFSEYATAHTSGVCKLPEDMSFEHGALVEPLAVASRAISQSGATYRDRIAVIGGGTIGQLCLAVAHSAGMRDTLITVKYDRQESLAKALNAGHIVKITENDDSTRTDSANAVADYVEDLTGGLGMDAVIVTVRGEHNVDAALRIVRNRGTVVLLAGYSEPVKTSLGAIINKEIVVTGSNCYGFSGYESDFQTSIDLIQSGKIDVTKVVTHRYSLESIARAFETAADKRTGAVKVLVCRNAD